jgi:hypothetical protein
MRQAAKVLETRSNDTAGLGKNGSNRVSSSRLWHSVELLIALVAAMLSHAQFVLKQSTGNPTRPHSLEPFDSQEASYTHAATPFATNPA